MNEKNRGLNDELQEDTPYELERCGDALRVNPVLWSR